MTRIVIGRLVSYVITLLIGFFVARHMLSADVAAKLMSGDTVELWGGAWTISIKQVADFVLLSIGPTLIPILIAIRGRIREKWKLIIARLSGEKLTDTEVQERSAEVSTPEMLKTVIAKP